MKNIRILIGKQKAFYNNVVSVFCPLLNDTVYFKSEGFYHLLHKSNGKRRKIDEQFLKLMCLTYAPEIIRNGTRIIETRKDKRQIKGKMKNIVTHEIIDGKRRSHNIAIVIERIDLGKLKFRTITVLSKRKYTK